MIDVSSSRQGALTEVVAVCPNEDLAAKTIEIFARRTTRFCRPLGKISLVVRVTAKRSEAAAIVADVEALSRRSSPAIAAPVPSARPVGEQYREAILANERCEAAAKLPVFRNGRRLVFVNFGPEFTAPEKFGHLWGDTVRYAYYAEG